MKKLSFVSKVLCAAGAILFANGCIDVDYVGQSFPALPAGTGVTIYTPSSPLSDRGNYRAIGHVSITAPDGTTADEINSKLIALARENGSDTVSIVEFKRVPIGPGAPDSSMAEQPNWRGDGRNMGGKYIYSNSFGSEQYTVPASSITELRVKALLLVTNEKFKAMTELYQKQRDKVFKKEDAPALHLTAEEALDRAQKPVAVPPEKPVKSPVKPDPKPLKMELNAGHQAPVML